MPRKEVFVLGMGQQHRSVNVAALKVVPSKYKRVGYAVSMVVHHQSPEREDSTRRAVVRGVTN